MKTSKMKIKDDQKKEDNLKNCPPTPNIFLSLPPIIILPEFF